MPHDPSVLFRPLALPCGVTLANRIAKAAMSDSLGDGEGNPTAAQARLYERWAEGGVGLSIVGEVQGDPRYAEKPGNLVLDGRSDHGASREPVDIELPRFVDPPEGGITAWYTMRLTELGEDREGAHGDLEEAIAAYETRDAERAARWRWRHGSVG